MVGTALFLEKFQRLLGTGSEALAVVSRCTKALFAVPFEVHRAAHHLSDIALAALHPTRLSLEATGGQTVGRPLRGPALMWEWELPRGSDLAGDGQIRVGPVAGIGKGIPGRGAVMRPPHTHTHKHSPWTLALGA